MLKVSQALGERSVCLVVIWVRQNLSDKYQLFLVQTETQENLQSPPIPAGIRTVFVYPIC